MTSSIQTPYGVIRVTDEQAQISGVWDAHVEATGGGGHIVVLTMGGVRTDPPSDSDAGGRFILFEPVLKQFIGDLQTALDQLQAAG